jgi:site-specific DNA recombinase
MPRTNGHGPKRAILYARVSTDEQARSGYSLAQQIEALIEYAAREWYEVLEEVSDPGQSGASLERPGMDRVRDLVAAGGVFVVLAQDRDRFAREPAYHYLLRREFEEHGTKIRALNDRGDDSPEGELTDGILDQLAKYERAKIAERTRRGKLRRAREGKVVATHTPDYGFEYNEARDNYLVNEAMMRVVRRIFRMVGVEGHSLNRVKKTLDREGVPTPKSSRYWGNTFIQRVITYDVYKPHTFEEVRTLVSEEVASRLDPAKRYGIWWFNRRRRTEKQVSQVSHNGRRYVRRSTTIERPREEWVAVPVPDSGIPREWVDAARKAISDNVKFSYAGGRFWELSGLMKCSGCGCGMLGNSPTNGSRNKVHHYYRCRTRHLEGKGACFMSKNIRAEEAEHAVWSFVTELLLNPEALRDGLDEMLDRERAGTHGNPGEETALWLDRLAEVERKRASFQDMAAEGLITFDELRTKLAALEATRQTARRELATLEGRSERLRALERDRDALLENYAEIMPEALDTLEPEERHSVYKMLRLKTVAFPDGTLEVSGALREGLLLCKDATRRLLSRGTSRVRSRRSSRGRPSAT